MSSIGWGLATSLELADKRQEKRNQLLGYLQWSIPHENYCAFIIRGKGKNKCSCDRDNKLDTKLEAIMSLVQYW